MIEAEEVLNAEILASPPSSASPPRHCRDGAAPSDMEHARLTREKANSEKELADAKKQIESLNKKQQDLESQLLESRRQQNTRREM